MTELVPPDEVNFVNGDPHFQFDECYRCFGEGLLYRLVNTEKKYWAFYNDTTDTVMKVTAFLGPKSDCKAVQRAKMMRRGTGETAPIGGDTSIPPGYEFAVVVTVNPGFTELFVEGTVSGFSMNFQSESAPLTNVVFENGKPSVPYNKVYQCFKGNGNGLLFRLVNTADSTWAFYNDTKNFTMRVEVDVEVISQVKMLGATVLTDTPSSFHPTGGILQLVIQPGKTEMLLAGQPLAYKLSFSADPVEEDELPEQINFLHGGPDPAIIPNCSHIYRCFKDNGNGLLFHVVDDVHHIWAFYNDTTEYEMTVNVRLPATDNLQLAPGVQTLPDNRPSSDDSKIHFVAAVKVPPLTTSPFLVGNPKDYELAFSAVAANKPSPEANVKFENGGPDERIIHATEVYKCFKDHGNGLLFRLVDTENSRWGFYNDTKDVTATVKVSYPSGAKVKPLGGTKLEVDEEMGTVFVLDVLPLETVLFSSGDLSTFTTKFTARR